MAKDRLLNGLGLVCFVAGTLWALLLIQAITRPRRGSMSKAALINTALGIGYEEGMKPAFAGVLGVSHAAMLAWYPWKLLTFMTQ